MSNEKPVMLTQQDNPLAMLAREVESLRAQLAEEQDSNQARLDYTEELQDQCRKVAIALHECGIEVDDFGEDLKIADGVQTLCGKLTKSEEETAFERGALQVAATDLHNSERELAALRRLLTANRRCVAAAEIAINENYELRYEGNDTESMELVVDCFDGTGEHRLEHGENGTGLLRLSELIEKDGVYETVFHEIDREYIAAAPADGEPT